MSTTDGALREHGRSLQQRPNKEHFQHDAANALPKVSSFSKAVCCSCKEEGLILTCTSVVFQGAHFVVLETVHAR